MAAMNAPNGPPGVTRTLSSGSLHNQPCVLQRKGGGELSTEITLSTLWEGTDRVAGTVWIGRDVSELEAARLQLAQAEKLSSRWLVASSG